MHKLIITIALYICVHPVSSQIKIRQGASMDLIVRQKNYPLLMMINQDRTISSALRNDTVLSNFRKTQRARLLSALNDCASNPACMINALFVTPEDMALVAARLNTLSRQGMLKKFIDNVVIPSGAYQWKLKDVPKNEQAGIMWKQDAAGINQVLSVYAIGSRPNYPLIDSNSLGISSNGQFPKGYALQIQQIMRHLPDVDETTGSFMHLQLAAASMFLSMNGRNQASDYEPMELGVNRAPARRADTLSWKRFHYSVILVPGAGPSVKELRLTPEAILRLELAVSAYRKGMAPFIMVSGGKVHPYKTEINEAVEMKQYLTDVLGVPESAVIVEPHARHTTTNLRNASRLMIKYGFPLDKPGLVCTSIGQSSMITGTLPDRCIRELGYIPYKNGNRLNEHLSEFFALNISFQVDADEPIDP
jgi:DUF218 domain